MPRLPCRFWSGAVVLVESVPLSFALGCAASMFAHKAQPRRAPMPIKTVHCSKRFLIVMPAVPQVGCVAKHSLPNRGYSKCSAVATEKPLTDMQESTDALVACGGGMIGSV